MESKSFISTSSILKNGIYSLVKNSGLTCNRDVPTILYENSMACITQMKDEFIKVDKTNHISPKFFFTHDLRKKCDINIQKIQSCNNLAVLFNKSLPTSKFEKYGTKQWYETLQGDQVMCPSGGIAVLEEQNNEEAEVQDDEDKPIDTNSQTANESSSNNEKADINDMPMEENQVNENMIACLKYDCLSGVFASHGARSTIFCYGLKYRSQGYEVYYNYGCKITILVNTKGIGSTNSHGSHEFDYERGR
ncbi:hypothetical protein LXL04_039658 [Taraxacum kok-saghyz]